MSVLITHFKAGIHNVVGYYPTSLLKCQVFTYHLIFIIEFPILEKLLTKPRRK